MNRGVAGGPVRHIPVMLQEVVEALAPRDGGIYVDGTFGAGGYALGLLAAADCRVIGIDRDPDAIAAGRSLDEAGQGRLLLCQGRFSQMGAHCAGHGITHVDGVTLDLGVSSMQIDEAGRGFSFLNDGPLDMRMERAGPSAADVVNTMTGEELARIIYVLGDEPRSRAIARAIVAARDIAPLSRTGQLAEIVSRALGGRRGARIHPATRTFQALRIFVNCELEELCAGLSAAETLMGEGGRLAVVSFHSLEDRIVKRFLRGDAAGRQGSRHMPEPMQAPGLPAFHETPRGGLAPSRHEVDANPRARSARLRAATRTAAPARPLSMLAAMLPAVPALPELS